MIEDFGRAFCNCGQMFFHPLLQTSISFTTLLAVAFFTQKLVNSTRPFKKTFSLFKLKKAENSWFTSIYDKNINFSRKFGD